MTFKITKIIIGYVYLFGRGDRLVNRKKISIHDIMSI